MPKIIPKSYNRTGISTVSHTFNINFYHLYIQLSGVSCHHCIFSYLFGELLCEKRYLLYWVSKTLPVAQIGHCYWINHHLLLPNVLQELDFAVYLSHHAFSNGPFDNRHILQKGVHDLQGKCT
jgi:hypothetical protein